MKRIVAIAAVVAAAFFGYRYYDGSYAPLRHYEQFAEEVLHRHYDAAAGMADGINAKELARLGTQEKIGAGPAMFQTLFPSRFDVQSQEKTADGGLTLHAVQTVLFNPPSVESAMRPAMYARMNQIITLRKSGGGWKVTSFENKFDSMDSHGSR